MYTRSAQIYDRMYAARDYRAHASSVTAAVSEHSQHPAKSLLEIGCGTGSILQHLVPEFEILCGLDVNAEMLDIARGKLPGVDFVQADMMDFDLHRKFDVVCCMFGTIAFARTVEGLRRALRNMAGHLSEDGVLLVEGYFSPESYWSDHVVLNASEHDGLKMAWMYRQEREGNMAITRVHHLIGSQTGVEHFVDTFEVGLFSMRDYEEVVISLGLHFIALPSSRSPGRPAFVAFHSRSCGKSLTPMC
jgi:ubiquinone/menaquinone biosynthesis C-methylase UbiE